VGSQLLNPDRKIDCIGLFCPMPIVKTREAIREMSVGQVLEVLADDPGSDPDLRSWTDRTGHELVETGRSGAIYRFLVRKRQ
jgi:TusA-related sulfurtransferase